MCCAHCCNLCALQVLHAVFLTGQGISLEFRVGRLLVTGGHGSLYLLDAVVSSAQRALRPPGSTLGRPSTPASLASGSLPPTSASGLRPSTAANVGSCASPFSGVPTLPLHLRHTSYAGGPSSVAADRVSRPATAASTSAAPRGVPMHLSGMARARALVQDNLSRVFLDKADRAVAQDLRIQQQYDREVMEYDRDIVEGMLKQAESGVSLGKALREQIAAEQAKKRAGWVGLPVPVPVRMRGAAP